MINEKLAEKCIIGLLILLVVQTSHAQSSIPLTPKRLQPVEKAESSPAASSMGADDSGTLGAGGIEVNFINGCDRSIEGIECESVLDASFGIGDRIQINADRAIEIQRGFGSPNFKGFGATEVGIKYRFLYTKKDLSMAIGSKFSFNNATQKIDKDGILELDEGNILYIPLILSKQKHNYTVVINLGYGIHLKDQQASHLITSFSLGRSINSNNRIMGEIYRDSDIHFQNARTDVRIGWVRMILPNKFKKYDASISASVGQSIGSTPDGVAHTTFNIGLSLSKVPRK